MEQVSSETVEAVRMLINSHAWRDYFEPTLLEAKEACIRTLLDPSEKRKAGEPDDYLRGRVDIINALLSLGPGLIADTDAQKDIAAEAKAVAEEYEERARSGQIGPFGR